MMLQRRRFQIVFPVRHVVVGNFRPAVDGDHAFFGVQADHDVAGKRLAGFGDELRVVNRFGANDAVADARFEIGFDGVQVADAAADLNRQFRESLADLINSRAVDGFAFESAVQVNHVEAACAFVDPAFRHGDDVAGNTVASSIRPWRSRTHSPSFKSIAGMSSMVFLPLNLRKF